MSADHSRPLRLAGGVSARKMSDLKRHLEASTVVVSVDSSIRHADLTADVLLRTLRRGLGSLILIAGDLPATFIDAVQGSVASVDPSQPLTIRNASDRLPAGAIRLHVGPDMAERGIRIVPEGFGAHVASSSGALIRMRRPANPLGAVYTASLGAAEVFKHTGQVRSQRRVLHRHLRFCPLSLSSDLLAAPDLPDELIFDLALIGVGAIGTGIVLLLEVLGAGGRLLITDPQRFGAENVATYSIGGWADGNTTPLKVDIASRHLKSFDVTSMTLTASDLVSAADEGRAPWMPTVLTAVDSAEARRDAQRLWPDRLIDSQTGDTMLGICDHRHAIDPCLACLFAVDRTRPSGSEIVAERLGLSMELLAKPDAILDDAHLEALTEEQQALLRPHIGKPTCGLAAATGLSRLGANDFMPSVPFVSLQASCLAVARLVAVVQGAVPTSNFVQYDGLFGPQTATVENMKRRPGCVCQTRIASIEQVRSDRRGRAAQLGG